MRYIFVCGFLIVLVAYSLSFEANLTDFLINQVAYYFSAQITCKIASFCFYYVNLLIKFSREKKLVTFQDCFEYTPDELVVVMIAVPKGGISFAAKTSISLFSSCGLTYGMNGLSSEWPRLDTVIDTKEYDFNFISGNAYKWESYFDLDFNKDKQKLCVSFLRTPAARFVSLYSYIRDESEFGLKEYSTKVNSMETVKERVEYLWQAIIQPALVSSHPALVKSVELNCTNIFVDDLFKGGVLFENEIQKLFDGLQIKPAAREYLIPQLRELDFTSLSKEQVEQNRHKSGTSLEPGEKEEVQQLIKSHPLISSFLNQQCLELKLPYC